ncbi:hypothetical protein HK098_003659, partial [Nowakowskiella sp. JEL0407]
LLSSPEKIRPCHINCTNISYFEAIANVLVQRPGITSILKTFRYTNPESISREDSKVRVDLVADQGKVWIKVKASSLSGVTSEFLPDSDFESDDDSEQEDQGEDSDNDEKTDIEKLYNFPVFKQAREWVVAAEQNKTAYITPKVVFLFYKRDEDDVDERIVEGLTGTGVSVEYFSESLEQLSESIIPTTDELHKQEDELKPTTERRLLCCVCAKIEDELTPTLNLDITSFIGITSQITFEPKKINFEWLDLDALKSQYIDECRDPLMNVFLAIFHQRVESTDDCDSKTILKECQLCKCKLKRRTVCSTLVAIEKFVNIVRLIGGWTEQATGVSLFTEETASSVTCLSELRDHCLSSQNKPPDFQNFAQYNPIDGITISPIPNSPSDRFARLISEPSTKKGEKLKDHHLTIFGTGDANRNTTVTSNAWVLRSFKQLGFKGISVFVHSPRSFVENREAHVQNGS